MVNAYTEQSILTEDEFFRREFGLNLVYDSNVNKLMNSEVGIPIIVVSPNPEIWLPLLRVRPRSSVIFFLIGNETYEPKIYNLLNDLPSIRHVFIYCLPSFIEWRSKFWAFLGDIYDTWNPLKPNALSGALRDFRTSFHLEDKFRRANIRYPHSALPQGYSNSFVKGLTRIGLIPIKDTSSLISNETLDTEVRKINKESRFIFVGQSTNRRRSNCIDIFSSNPDNLIITKHSGFGGTNFDGDLSYIKNLTTAWFNVIPPGHFNNFNHRYTESLIVRSIPVILAHNSIDHSANDNWSNRLKPLTAHSFRKLKGHLLSLSELELSQLSTKIRELDFAKIEACAAAFEKLISSDFQDYSKFIV